jgi:hypothetical protein
MFNMADDCDTTTTKATKVCLVGHSQPIDMEPIACLCGSEALMASCSMFGARPGGRKPDLPPDG